ncbi:MAG: antitoxin [Candidatus Wallbacteria bacterium]|nr:antitoxin [Candidatus Wallbacteria bacterium]
MHTKLTLSMDEEVIRKAKQAAKEMGKSVSGMVEDFLAAVTKARGKRKRGELTPVVRSLLGCLKGAAVDEEDYKNYLEEKYR